MKQLISVLKRGWVLRNAVLRGENGGNDWKTILVRRNLLRACLYSLHQSHTFLNHQPSELIAENRAGRQLVRSFHCMSVKILKDLKAQLLLPTVFVWFLSKAGLVASCNRGGICRHNLHVDLLASMIYSFPSSKLPWTKLLSSIEGMILMLDPD